MQNRKEEVKGKLEHERPSKSGAFGHQACLREVDLSLSDLSSGGRSKERPIENIMGKNFPIACLPRPQILYL